jgi:hypothetical protein
MFTIPYIATFTILQNIVVNSNYSMLLGRPWLKDVKLDIIREIT